MCMYTCKVREIPVYLLVFMGCFSSENVGFFLKMKTSYCNIHRFRGVRMDIFVGPLFSLLQNLEF